MALSAGAGVGLEPRRALGKASTHRWGESYRGGTWGDDRGADRWLGREELALREDKSDFVGVELALLWDEKCGTRFFRAWQRDCTRDHRVGLEMRGRTGGDGFAMEVWGTTAVTGEELA
jgi:hypothetical protein